jgi:hypothetical protein
MLICSKNPYNVLSYKKVVDAFFTFERDYRVPLSKAVEIHSIVVDTSKKSLRDSGDGDVEIGFNKEVYFLCAAMIGKRFKKSLFHLYPDRREITRPLSEAQKIMNLGARKHGDKREWPFRRLQFKEPEDFQALQVVDIFIGALAFRLNGHDPNSKQGAAKKRLSDYILRRAKIADPFKRTPYYLRRFGILHRDGAPKGKKAGHA